MLKLQRFTLRRFSILLILSFILGSCDDIIERDVSGSTVILLAPSDNITSTSTKIDFRWEKPTFSSKYRLQVVEPSFLFPMRYLLDTLLEDHYFSYFFTKGDYQWRVRYENGSSSGVWTSWSFSIDSIQYFSKQVVVPQFPTNGFGQNSSTVFFKWNKVTDANKYRLEIHKGSWNSSVSYNNEAIVSDSITIQLEEGKYIWAVLASNDTAQTAFSELRTLFIDQTSPNVSNPGLPAEGEIVVIFPYKFTWTKSLDAGSAISDSIYLLTENGTAISTLPGRKSAINELEYISIPSGKYSWRIKSFDAAGNQSQLSPLIKFSVQ